MDLLAFIDDDYCWLLIGQHSRLLASDWLAPGSDGVWHVLQDTGHPLQLIESLVDPGVPVAPGHVPRPIACQ